MEPISRRTFARAGVTAASAWSASRVLGANERIRIGLIGAGGRGRQLLEVFLKQPDVDIVDVCDVYDKFRDRGVAMTQNRAESHKDFRRVLDRKDIDAVIVAAPDHWHALMTVAACNAGKDVYCEKPLTLLVAEGRRMVEAARRNRRVVQTGSQQRSGAHYADAVRMVHEGAIGQVHRIHAGMQRNAAAGFRPTELASGLTAALDWDMWLGPAPFVPFDPFRCIYNFRWFWDYSGGQMTNWGAHHLDIARWIMNSQAPLTVSGAAGRYVIKDGGETPDIQQVTYRFPNGIVTWTTSEVAEGKGFTLDVYGSRGMMSLTRGGFTVQPETTGRGKDKVPAMQPIMGQGGDLDGPHVRNFLDCVKNRKSPNADVEEGHRSAAMCHLGNLASRLNRTLQWDAAKEEVTGDAQANRLLMKTYRAPWRLA